MQKNIDIKGREAGIDFKKQLRVLTKLMHNAAHDAPTQAMPFVVGT